MKSENPRHRQLTREWRLLRELQAEPRGRTYVELAKALGAAPRTVYRDLKTLQQAGFPIERARLHTKSVWRMSAGSTPAILFSAGELSALAMARNMLLSVPGSPFDGPLRQAFQKIQAACDREGLRMLDMADKRLYADLRRARPYSQREVWFKVLLGAVFRQRAIRIRYYTLERDSDTERVVEPYAAVYHDGAFYLIGRCRMRNEVRTFLVDRIRSAVETKETFSVPGDFSVREHFRQAWGLIKNRALARVRVKFAREVARIIREGRWHESQRLEEAGNGAVILEVKVAGWKEMERWIMSFGSRAEVLEPDELKRSVGAEAGRMARLYGRSSGRKGKGGNRA